MTWRTRVKVRIYRLLHQMDDWLGRKHVPLFELKRRAWRK